MKKLILAFSVMGLIGLSSCNKDWTCQCTDQNGNNSFTAIHGGSFYHAKHTCNNMNSNTTVAGVHKSENCDLLTVEK